MTQRVLFLLFLFTFSSGRIFAQLPGEKGGRILLPNGWWLSPAGDSIDLDDLPLNAAVSPDQKYLAVTHAVSQAGAASCGFGIA